MSQTAAAEADKVAAQQAAAAAAAELERLRAAQAAAAAAQAAAAAAAAQAAAAAPQANAGENDMADWVMWVNNTCAGQPANLTCYEETMAAAASSLCDAEKASSFPCVVAQTVANLVTNLLAAAEQIEEAVRVKEVAKANTTTVSGVKATKELPKNAAGDVVGVHAATLLSAALVAVAAAMAV